MNKRLRLSGGDVQEHVSFALRDGEWVVGSDAECDLVLRHPSVSRRHARLVIREGEVELTDLDSRNGTFAGGVRVVTERVNRGARLRFGQLELQLEELNSGDDEVAEPGLPETARSTNEVSASRVTAGLLAADAFVRDGLPRLHELLSQRSSRLELSLVAGPALAAGLSLAALEIVELEGKEESLLFTLGPSAQRSEAQTRVRRGDVEVRAVPLASLEAACAPLLSVVASLVQLAKPAAGPLPTTVQNPKMPAPSSTSPAVVAVYRDAERVAVSEVSVLILGESGTGKELLALHLHDASPRRKGPFVALNCAALSKDLLEAQLFGVERGVATGVEARAGIFEAADEGTLFLDEVGDMALETQARILRVLEVRQVARIGATTLRPARVRVIAATHHDLMTAVAEGRFRLDLFHRLAGWQTELPPLRARQSDIPQLALHFLSHALRQRGVEARGLSRAAMDLLIGFPWPGNVRQLKSEMERAALFVVPGQLVDTTCLSPRLRQARPVVTPSTLKERLEVFERNEIARTLGAQSGDIDRAAQELGISRSTLYRRIKELGLNDSSSQP